MPDARTIRPLIAILRGIDPEEAVPVAEVLVEAGIGMIEVPMNSPQPFESISRMATQLPNDAIVGGGTVTQVDQVAELAAVGGQFVVSPDCHPDVIVSTKAEGMLSFPGVLSPSECFLALRNGADGLKLFPSFMVAPDGLKAINAVLPAGTKIFAVGGVGPAQFRDWITAGATGFGIGSSLYTPGASLQQIKKAAQSIVTAFDQANM